MSDLEAGTQAASQPSEAAVSQPAGGEQQSEGRTSSFFDRLLGRAPKAQEKGEGAKTEASATAGAEQAQVEEKAARSLPESEEFKRAVQAEADRREAKRQAAAARERERVLLKNDPVRASQERLAALETEEQAGGFGRLVGQIVADVDRHVLDPLLTALPEDERATIVGEGIADMAGRKGAVEKALKSLERKWKAEGAEEARAQLRKDPAFRKRMLVDWRAEKEEPELLPAGTSGTGGDVNGFLRGVLRSKK